MNLLLIPLQIGGNSLQAGALCSRLRATLGMEQAIPLVWVFQNQTICALAARLAASTAEAASARLPLLRPIVSQSGGDITAPLSFQQASSEAGAPPLPCSFEAACSESLPCSLSSQAGM